MTIRTSRASLSLSCVLAAACAQPGATTTTATKAEPVAKAVPAAKLANDADVATPAGPPKPGESRVLTGTLRYTAIPATKSVASFRSEDLTLVGDNGDSWNLGGSAAVPEDKLVALAGKRVEVTATYVPPTAPDPNAQAPMDGDTTMEFPARWDVTAVRAFEP